MGGLLVGRDETSQHLASANLPDRDKCWGGGEGEGGKRGRHAQSSSLNISGPQARSAKDTLVLLPLFRPPPLYP